MFAKEIPDFIDEVMEQIEIGIVRVATRKDKELGSVRRAEGSTVDYGYPEHVEMMLGVDAKIDDGTAEGGYEHQSIWVKIPWPKSVA